MASILQRGKKRRWYAMYRDENGKQHCDGLSAEDRREAQEEANLREDIANRRKDPQILRRSIDQLFEKYTSSAPSIRQHLKQWLENQKALGGAVSSSANRQTAIDKFLDYLDSPSDHPAEYVKSVRNDREAVRRPFTVPELRTILQNAPDQECIQ